MNTPLAVSVCEMARVPEWPRPIMVTNGFSDMRVTVGPPQLDGYNTLGFPGADDGFDDALHVQRVGAGGIDVGRRRAGDILFDPFADAAAKGFAEIFHAAQVVQRLNLARK